MNPRIIGVLAFGVALAGVFVALGLRGNNPAQSGLVGQRMAPVELALLPATPTPTTTRVTLPDVAPGGRLLVHFWGPTCAPCVAEAPAIQAFHDKAATSGVPIITISGDDTEDIRAFMRARGHTYRVLHDPNGKAHRTWEVVGLPSTFLVDDKGTILAGGSGPLEQLNLNIAR